MKKDFPLIGMYLAALTSVGLLVFQLSGIKTSGLSDNLDRLEKEKIFLEVTQESLKDIYRIWMMGDFQDGWYKGDYNCPDVLGTHEGVYSGYLACNPGLLECLGRKNHTFTIKHKNGKNYKAKLRQAFATRKNEKRFYQIVTRNNFEIMQLPDYAVMIELGVDELPEFKQNVLLADICDQVFLPQGTYALGPYTPKSSRMGKSDWKWDNKNQYYYIDKYQVTNRDVLDWIDYGDGDESLRTGMEGKLLGASATHLTKLQMERFCAFRGKTILTAPLFDAATFYPWEGHVKKTQEIFRGPYPWSTRADEGFLYKAKQNQKYSVTMEDCQLVYTADCLQRFPLMHRSRNSVSWMGVYQVLGGYLEYMRNPVDPAKNLKMSSFYFDSKSSWHQLGMRGYWDGEGFESRNFSNGLLPEMDGGSYEVAFRCSKEAPRGD